MNKLIKSVLVTLAAILPFVPSHAGSLPDLWKNVGNYNPPDGTASAETSIVVDQNGIINDGKPFTITFQCGDETAWPPPPGNTPTLVIRDVASRAILKTVIWPNGGYRGFAVNQTIGGLVHIFGTQDPSNLTDNNGIVHSTLDATLTPTSGVLILQTNLYESQGLRIKEIAGFVSPNPQGGWSLNYANQYGAGFFDWPDANFTPGQKSVGNPNGWTNVPSGQLFNGTSQSCAAQWNAADGYWYETVQNLQASPFLLWVTMARSTDRVHWTYSPIVLLYPDMPAIEGIDNSDVRMVEYQGGVILIYLDGDQSTWSNIRIATFHGTMANLYAKFF